MQNLERNTYLLVEKFSINQLKHFFWIYQGRKQFSALLLDQWNALFPPRQKQTQVHQVQLFPFLFVSICWEAHSMQENSSKLAPI